MPNVSEHPSFFVWTHEDANMKQSILPLPARSPSQNSPLPEMSPSESIELVKCKTT